MLCRRIIVRRIFKFATNSPTNYTIFYVSEEVTFITATNLSNVAFLNRFLKGYFQNLSMSNQKAPTHNTYHIRAVFTRLRIKALETNLFKNELRFFDEGGREKKKRQEMVT